MHETYVVPAGNWETIYYNFTPFGLGQIKQLIDPDPEEKSESTSQKENYTSGLIEAKEASWKSMKLRMARLASEYQPLS